MASPLEQGQPPTLESPRCFVFVDETSQEQQVERADPPERRGSFDCELVESPQEPQKDCCPICLVGLREPFQVTCCGCSFCRTCIERVLTNKKACPTCNEANFSAFSRLQRALYSFRVQCVHQKSGCEWIGELGELDGHLNLSPELGRQLIGCEFAAVACTHCFEYLQRRHVHAHENESCPQRPFSCDYCKEYGSVYEDVVNNHWPVCKCYPVPCPNECGVSPERQNVETHVNTVCPLTVVNCDFHYAGCEVQLVRKDMPTHLAESLATHISLLTTQTQTLAGRGGQEKLFSHLSLLTLHNQQLAQLILQQQEDLEELQEDLEESQLKIQALERVQQTQISFIAEMQKSSEASQREIEDLKVKVNENMEREAAMVRKLQDRDRASLQTLLQHTGMLPFAFRMTNFEEMKENNGTRYSLPFYTHPQGYKMCLSVVANGSGRGKGTHVSVYAYLMRGEFDDYLKWPFQGDIVLQLCNQLEDKRHCGDTIDFSKTTDRKVINRVTSGERAESGRGTPVFIAHSDLTFSSVNNCQYLKDDCLHFRVITVDSLSEPGVLPTERTMTNFEQHKTKNDQWYSPPFYTHPRGYKMCLDVNANGSGDGRGTHVSVFAFLMRGEFDDHLEWPFRGHVTVAMLNQLEDDNHIIKTIPFTETSESKHIGRVTIGDRAPGAWGCPTFIAHTDLKYNPVKNCQYLKYDCLCFQIVKVELK